MFCTVSLMEKLLPSRTVAGGLVTLVSVRSGKAGSGCSPYTMRLLFALAKDTKRICLNSSNKINLYAALRALTITVTVPLEVALEASEGTARPPFKRRAPLFDVVVDMLYRVVEAAPDSLPFPTRRSSDLKLLPSRTVAGGLVTLVSVKSGKPGSGSSPYTMRLFWVPTNTFPSAAIGVAK